MCSLVSYTIPWTRERGEGTSGEVSNKFLKTLLQMIDVSLTPPYILKEVEISNLNSTYGMRKGIKIKIIRHPREGGDPEKRFN